MKNPIYIKNAILAGADLLEANQDRYNLFSNTVNRKGSQCILGFIGEALDYPDGTNVSTVEKDLKILYYIFVYAGRNSCLELTNVLKAMRGFAEQITVENV